jgi:MFS family permease
MPDPTNDATPAAESKARWIELLQGDRAAYSILLNLGIGLHALDVFVITTIMPAVVADIGGMSFYTWTAMLYMVGSICGAAAGGHMRAKLGRQRGYVWGGVVLLLGTIACAVSPDMATLLVARTLKGIGGGLVISQSMALVRDLYEPRIRTRILATITTTWSIAALLGPLIGGVFAEIGWWRGAFWATAPFTLCFMWMAWRYVPAETIDALTRRFPIRRLGLLAAGVMAIGLTSQISDPLINSGLIVLSAFLVWLTLRLDGASEHGLFPSQPFSLSGPVGLAYWMYLCISVTHSALLIFAPLFLQVLHNLSPLYIGYLSLVFSIGWTVGAIGVSGWSDRGEKIALVGGMATAAVATIGFIFAVINGPLLMVTFYIAIIGIGIGATNVIATTFGMSVAKEGEESITASAMQTVRALGVAFGAAIAGLVANNAGLDQNTEAATVANVAMWVLGFTACVPVICALIAWRAASWGWQFRTEK